MVIRIYCVLFFLASIAQAQPDVVVVGAGPVGLFTAIQTKLYSPQIKIRLFEKHKTYQRNHTVSLAWTSFYSSHPDEKFQQLIKNYRGAVRTSTMEKELLDFATSLGIKITYEAITDVNELKKRYPQTKIIVGADGSHSIVRKHFVDPENLSRKNLNYLVEVKYNAVGATRSLNMWTNEIIPLLNKVNHFVVESVGHQHDDKTPVSLRIFVSSAEYLSLRDHTTFAKPLMWQTEEAEQIIPDELKHTIGRWLVGRAEMAHEIIEDDSVKITVTNLPEYFSPKVVFNVEGVHHFLVGDAAFGVPYFRSINNGLLAGNMLARVIDFLYKHQGHTRSSSTSTKLIAKPVVKSMSMLVNYTPDYYQTYMDALQTKEQMRAAVKNSAYHGINSLVSWSQASHQFFCKSFGLSSLLFDSTVTELYF